MSAAELLLLILAAFVALTAIGGGIALALGLEGDRIPLDWLEGTPFDTYLAPGLILSGLVGGSSLVASVALVVDAETGSALAALAGAVLLAYIGVEIRILNQPSAPTATEVVYGMVGTTMIALGCAALL